MSALIDKSGLFRIPAADYHADPSAMPSLSSGIAKILVNRTPRHAWYKHPRLNPFFDPRDDDELKRRTAFGSLCHELFLGVGGGVHLMEAKDKDGNPVTKYQTDEAKKERDEAIASGMVPAKVEDFERSKTVVDEARKQLLSWLDFDGESEVVGLAHFDGAVTRFMCDRLLKDERTIIDLKFTDGDASTAEWPRQAARMNYHIQAGHYRAGLAQILGVDIRHTDFLFVVIEVGPPVMVIAHELPPAMSEIGIEQAESARATWGHCLKHGTEMQHWPGYEPGRHRGDDPGWLIAKHEAQSALAKLAFSPIDVGHASEELGE